MSISVYPIASESSATAFSGTATTSGVLYEAAQSLNPGVYRITCVSSTISTVQFFSGNTFVGEATTSSGTIDVNIGSAVNKIRFFTNTGSSIIVTITLLASALSTSTFSGTLETLTSTQTYTQTGAAYVVVVGAGGGGGAYTTNGDYRSTGAGSGGINTGFILLNGNTSVTIGSQGNAGIGGGNNAQSGNTGGTTSFGSLTANGGEGGHYDRNIRALGGTPGGAAGGGSWYYFGNGIDGIASSPSGYPFVKTGTTGSGAGSGTTGSNTGAGSGIGTGGTLNSVASGYGAGGVGGRGNNAGNGTQGVVYLMRV
jgi:hypothetical protein